MKEVAYGYSDGEIFFYIKIKKELEDT